MIVQLPPPYSSFVFADANMEREFLKELHTKKISKVAV
jgi:hypothetical protein